MSIREEAHQKLDSLLYSISSRQLERVYGINRNDGDVEPSTPVPPLPPRRGPPWPAAPFSGHHRHYASHEHHPHRNNSHDLYFLFRVHFPPTNITITPALQTVKEKYRPRSFHCSAQVFIIIKVVLSLSLSLLLLSSSLSLS